MSDNLQKKINALEITIAANEYPILKDLKYFRDYSDFIENTLNDKLSEIHTNVEYNKSIKKSKEITLEEIMNNNDIRKYNSFTNIMRISLLMAICSFVEKVITSRCYEYENFNNFKNKRKKLKGVKNKKKKNLIIIAKDFLYTEGYIEIVKIDGWSFIEGMVLFRNRFVHQDGQVDKNIEKMKNNYKFSVTAEGKITLDKQFIEDYITLLEKFLIEFTKIIYPRKGFLKLFPL